ncbi:peptidylprolyl isomerase [Leptolyngbya sp. FACHB-671]|uniref:peptidylprolyl isomerase n=1 Tax=Leptolyngbya sp. FACHB-671 TaxID=2692812 RepID=UPI0016856B6F|nr:peptidylprolyl isomerase [Leptolyngbya sp. FACHB-671]MBD2066117.1 peptidylprolyl isomerase [Leptolyngbya sp. FACHB-671]
MLDILTISPDDILHHVKLSCRIPSIVEEILTQRIIAKTAAETGINAEPEELQKAADHLRLMNNLRSTDATWSWLQKHSLSLDDLEELVRITLISSKLCYHLFADKVKPYFIEHQLDYTQVIMHEVVLGDKDVAMELFYALQEGEISFPDVARQYIQDTEFRRIGGYQGALNRTALMPEISAAVFAAAPPQILKPILTCKGVHLISVEELIQPELNDELYQKILSTLFSEWLKQQIEQIDVQLGKLV